MNKKHHFKWLLPVVVVLFACVSAVEIYCRMKEANKAGLQETIN